MKALQFHQTQRCLLSADELGCLQGSGHQPADRPEEECGVIGIFHPDTDVAPLLYLGLFALQHRGQESAGITISTGQALAGHRGMGLVQTVLTDEVLDTLRGRMGIGHVRYSTTGSSHISNSQPLMARCASGQWALAHNGNLVNAESLRQEMMSRGAVFQTTTDSEVILNLAAWLNPHSLPDAAAKAANMLQGGYALALMDRKQLVGLRDPNGIRPLCVGAIGDGYILASESCAITNLKGKVLREIAPGEMVVIDENGVHFQQAVAPRANALCSFEYIYFARPDSVIGGRSAYAVRKAIGYQLAQEYRVDVDVVIGAPDSGITAALGYAQAAGIPYEVGLLKNRYIGRTFIQPHQQLRDLGVQIKLNPIAEVLRDKRVLVIDDSIVRGTTSARMVQMIRSAGAASVHMAVASPPYRFPCYYGIDTSAGADLIACNRSEQEIAQLIGVDSLHYLSQDGLVEAVGLGTGQLCLACFSGEYPVLAQGQIDKRRMERIQI